MVVVAAVAGRLEGLVSLYLLVAVGLVFESDRLSSVFGLVEVSASDRTP